MRMTDLKKMPERQLLDLWHTLSADRLPQGTFDGLAWPVPVGWLWRGKVFEGATVRNRIGPWLLAEGAVRLGAGGLVYIEYGGGVVDHVAPVTPDLWLGQMRLAGLRPPLWFALERATPGGRSGSS